MKISGVVVACAPGKLDEVVAAVGALPWASVHHTDPKGRIVATLEAADEAQSISRLRRIQRVPGVVMAELAAYYAEDP